MKLQNKLLLVMLFLIGCMMSAEAQKTKQLFREYRQTKGVRGMSIGGPLIDLAIGFSDLEKEDKKALRKMAKGAGFFVIEELNRKGEHRVLNQFANHLEDDSFVDLATVKSDGQLIQLKLRERKGQMRELVGLVYADDAVIGFVLNGKFDPENMKGLVKRLNNKTTTFNVNFKP